MKWLYSPMYYLFPLLYFEFFLPRTAILTYRNALLRITHSLLLKQVEFRVARFSYVIDFKTMLQTKARALNEFQEKSCRGKFLISAAAAATLFAHIFACLMTC